MSGSTSFAQHSGGSDGPAPLHPISPQDSFPLNDIDLQCAGCEFRCTISMKKGKGFSKTTNSMKHVLTLFLSIGLGQCLHADVFTTSDFLNPGDQLLVTDTTTGLQWLKPTYTTNQSYDDPFIQNLINTDGFSYATEAQVDNMITGGFPGLPEGAPVPSGYTTAQAFFSIFGATYQCPQNGVPCTETVGFTSTALSSQNGDNIAVAVYDQSGPLEGSWSNQDVAVTTDAAFLGSWLVRDPPAPSPVPEPVSVVLLASLCGITFRAHRLRKSR